jgi:predicted RNase H-like nuclease (RuvC/YqgF family)
MSLEPEILAAIQEAVKGTITEVVKPLSDQLEKVQYDSGKLTEALTGLSTSIPSQLDERFGAINPTLEFLNELRKEVEAEQQETPKKQSEIEAALVKAKQEYEAKFNQLQRELEERDKEAQALKEADRKSRIRNNVLAQMRGIATIRPNTEEDLLTILEKRGLIVEDGDKLFVKSTDKFGGQINAEFKDILPKMLESDFAHFAVPRGGTGTDGQPGNRTQSQGSQYDFASMTAQQIHNICESDPNARKELDRILEERYK